MSFLLDTNVLSEVRKGDRRDQRVDAWYRGVDTDDLFVSVLVLGELRRGIERLRVRDAQQAGVLEAWLELVANNFADRTLGVDRAVCEQWGRMEAEARRPIPTVDGLLAATAVVHELTLVTRDTRDVRGLGATVLNPFDG